MKKLQYIYRLIEISYKFHSVHCIFESVNLDIFDEFKEVVKDHELNSLSFTEHQKKVSLESGDDLLKETDQLSIFSNKEDLIEDRKTETQIINPSYLSKNEFTTKYNSTNLEDSTNIKYSHIDLDHSYFLPHLQLFQDEGLNETFTQKLNSTRKRKNISESSNSIHIDVNQSSSSDNSVPVRKIKSTKYSEDPIQNEKNNKIIPEFILDKSRNASTQIKSDSFCVKDQILKTNENHKRTKPECKKNTNTLELEGNPPIFYENIIVLFTYRINDFNYLDVNKIIDVLDRKTFLHENKDHKIENCRICRRYLLYKEKEKIYIKNAKIKFLKNRFNLDGAFTNFSPKELELISLLVNISDFQPEEIQFDINYVETILKKFLTPLNLLLRNQAGSNTLNILLHNFNQLYFILATILKIQNNPIHILNKSIKYDLMLYNEKLNQILSVFGIELKYNSLKKKVF